MAETITVGHWTDFLDQFTLDHAGRPVTVEVLQAHGWRNAWPVVNLERINARMVRGVNNGDDSVAIVITGGVNGIRFSHEMSRPICIQQTTNLLTTETELVIQPFGEPPARLRMGPRLATAALQSTAALSQGG